MKIFISHASEDKDAVARQLAESLRSLGHSVWYDEYSLRKGDRLRESIDQGLAECDFGVVIFSHHFFSKSWPREELEGLSSREAVENRKMLIPVWHGLDVSQMVRYSPSLAGRVAIKTDTDVSMVGRLIDDSIRLTMIGGSAFAEPLNPRLAEIQNALQEGEGRVFGTFSRALSQLNSEQGTAKIGSHISMIGFSNGLSGAVLEAFQAAVADLAGQFGFSVSDNKTDQVAPEHIHGNGPISKA